MASSPGQTYTYRIILLDSVGAEAGRIERQVTVAPPRRPDPAGKVSASTGKNNVTVTWSYPRFQGGDADLTVGFNVLRSGQGQAPVLLTPSPVLRIEGALQFVDSQPLVDTSVTYSVQAVDIIGSLSDPVAAPAVTFKDTTPPMAPQGVTAVDRKDGILLVWKISPEAKADHYVVYRSDKEDSGYEQISKAVVPVSQPRFIDPNPAQRGRLVLQGHRCQHERDCERDVRGGSHHSAEDDTPAGRSGTDLHCRSEKAQRLSCMDRCRRAGPERVPDLPG